MGTPLAGATLAIVDKAGAGHLFIKTDKDGLFRTEIDNSVGKLWLKISLLGFQQVMIPVDTLSDKQVIVLKQSARQLQEVVIKSKTKISLSSDTVKYNTKSFADENDRVIADLIGRLPGIQVDEKGGITYNGKRINRVYIDGDDLTNGKYGQVTNNVPVSAVEEVQVIERDQPIKALNGYTLSNNVSLNLKLTAHARTVTINTGHLAAGNKVHSTVFNNLIFKRKVKAINNIKSNSNGNDLERDQADLSVSSSASEVTLKTPHYYLSMESQSQLNIPERYYLLNQDHAVNVNTLYKMLPDWSLRLNVARLQLKRQYSYYNQLEYFLPNDQSIRYDEQNSSIIKSNQWHLEAQVEKNSNSSFIRSITKLELPEWIRTANTNQNNVAFNQNQPSQYNSLSNETSIIKALKNKHIVQYNSVIQHYKLDEQLAIAPPLHLNLAGDSISYSLLNQDTRSNNFFINQSANIKIKINALIISASAGLSFENNRLISDLYKRDSNSLYTALGPNYHNDINFRNLSIYNKTSVLYVFERGAVSIETNPTFGTIEYSTQSTGPKLQKKYALANPTVEFRKNIGKYGESNIRYFNRSDFGQINDIYAGTMLVNYRQLNLNDSPLPTTQINTLNFRYSYRKPIKMLFYSLNLSYDHLKQNVINTFTIDSGLTRSAAIRFKNSGRKYNANAALSKYLFFIETNMSVSAGLSLQEGNSFYNNQISPFETYNVNVLVNARKKLFAKMTITLTADMARLINEQTSSQTLRVKNTTTISRFKAEWQHNFTEQISYGINYSYSAYRQSMVSPIQNNFLDVDFKFSPKASRSIFEFQAFNLLNQNTYRQINTNANQQSVFQTPLRSCTLLFKYSFNF